MFFYQIAGGEGGVSPQVHEPYIRRLASGGIRSLELDVRSLPGEEAVGLAASVERLRRWISIPRLHCRPQHLEEAVHALGRGLSLDIHVRSRELDEFQQQAAEMLEPSDDWTLTLHLEPGVPLPALRLEPRGFRLTFVSPWESGSPEPDSYAESTRQGIGWIRRLASRWTPVSILGPLPFCIVSPADQGLLARECLAADDYRRGELHLAFHPDGTVTPWAGRLRHLYRRADEATLLSALVRFYEARSGLMPPRMAFAACEACDLRALGTCAAWDYYAPPSPASLEPGVLRLGQMASEVGQLVLEPHPEAHLEPSENGGGTLCFPDRRTFDALRLNPTAAAVWHAAVATGRLDALLRETCGRWGEALLEPVLELMETFQHAGFLRLHRNGASPAPDDSPRTLSTDPGGCE